MAHDASTGKKVLVTGFPGVVVELVCLIGPPPPGVAVCVGVSFLLVPGCDRGGLGGKLGGIGGV